jgi:hypothetical protein
MKWPPGFSKWFRSRSNETTSNADSKETPAAVAQLKNTAVVRQPLSVGIRVRREKVHIQVGVDFGTSTTKIAYRQIGARVRQVVALNFAHNFLHYPTFCLPSLAAFDGSGNLLIGYDAATFLADKPVTDGLRYQKLVLAGEHDKTFFDSFVTQVFMDNLNRLSPLKRVAIEHIVTAFLAHTFREIRERLKTKYSGQDLDLSFNVCAPIDHIQSNPLNTVFEKILAAAEAVESDLHGRVRGNDLLERSALAFESGEQRIGSSDRRVFLVPESVGAIASYLASLQVRNGIHAVYDFGAGTTDISIFEISKAGNGVPFTSWFAARNLARGSQKIERLASNFLNSAGMSGQLTDVNLSGTIRELMKQPIALQEQVRVELRELWKDSHIAWREAYGRLKTQSAWEKQKVQVFVCGGASRIPFIKEIFSQSWMVDWGPYPFRDLPAPDVYEPASVDIPYTRLCVAYGLTTPQPELGDFVLPRDCPNHTPEKLKRSIPPVYGSFDPDG